MAAAQPPCKRARRTLAAALLLAAMAAALPGAEAHGRGALATPGGKWACGQRPLTPAQQAASQADLELFIRRVAAATAGQKKAATPTTTVVPVYWHIIRAGMRVSQGSVPKAWITAQMTVLNHYYAPVGFRFKLVAINIYTNATCFDLEPDSKEELETKIKYKKGGLTTLNVYTGYFGDVLAGYAYTPDSFQYIPSALDGCVIAYDTLPGSDLQDYSTGKTLVHEVGHWLGLLHTFEPSYTAQGAALGGCIGPGDYVADTPAEFNANYGGCPTNPRRDTCPTYPGPDPVHNFMDYSVDACRYNFTPGQISRMRAMYSRYRASGSGYAGQSNNNARNAAGNVPAGGVPSGCASCVCYPEGYCICVCGGEARTFPAA